MYGEYFTQRDFVSNFIVVNSQASQILCYPNIDP